MPELPINFNPARAYNFRDRLLEPEQPSISDLSDAPEQETPRLAFFFLLLFMLLWYSRPASWLPGAPSVRSAEEVTGIALFVVRLRIALLSGFAAFFAIVFYKHSRGERFFFTKPETTLMMLIIVQALVSVPFALHPTRALTFARSDLLKLFTIFFITINTIRNVRSLKIFMWTVAVFGCIPAIGSVLFNLYSDHYLAGIRAFDGRFGWRGYFENPNTVGAAMCTLIPLGLLLIQRSKAASAKCIALGFVLLYGIALLLVQTRGAMVALAMVLPMYIATSRKKMLMMMLIGLVVAISLAAVPGAIDRAATIRHYRQDASAIGRIQVWKAGLRMVYDRPLWGVGANCFNIGSAAYIPRFTEAASARWLSAHSTYVQIMAELGLPGLAILGILIYVTLRDANRVYKRLVGLPSQEAQELALMSRSLFFAFLSICLMGLTLHFAYDWTMYMFIALIVCVKQMSWRFVPENAQT